MQKTRIGKKRLLRRWAKLGMLVSIVAAFGFGIYFFFQWAIDQEAQAKEIKKSGYDVEAQTGSMSDNYGELPETLDGTAILKAMNEMCHQKVVANDKWGAVEMNKENIHKLQKAAKSEIGNEEVIEILNKWDQGDFSDIVSDHNEILGIQGGTIGEATGVMTEQEEKDFIENNFR
jgi:hypothetical protein